MAKRKGPGDEIFDFIGFAPDAPVDTPGACSVMDDVLPTTRGWRAAPGEASTDMLGTPTLAYPVYAAHVFSQAINGMLLVRGGQATYGGAEATVGAVYAVAGAVFSVAPKTVTGTMGLPGRFQDSTRPKFLNFGNYVLCKPNATLCAAEITSTSVTTFAPIAGAISDTQVALVAANRFVVAFDSWYTWRCSARDDHTSWTANPATLAAFGQLTSARDDTNRCAVSMGDEIILFKTYDAWLGRFEPGNEEVWVWNKIGLNVTSLPSSESAARYKRGVVFLSYDGLLYYDGANVINLMDERMRRWYVDRVATSIYYNAVVVDEWRDLIWVSVVLRDDDDGTSLPSGASKKTLLVCDPKTKRWARYTRKKYLSIFSAPAAYPGSHIYGASGAPSSDLNTVWGLPIDSPYKPKPISTPATASAVSQIVTNDFGHPFGDVELTRANLKFIVAPTGTAPIATGLYRNNLDDSLITATPVARSSDGHFDVRQQARWHRLQFDLYGDWELDGYAVDAGIVGVR